MEYEDWMSEQASSEIESALKVQKTVKKDLRSSPVILSTPDVERLHSLLCQLTGQFIVPDPLEEWKAPYLLDQLWIMLYPNRKVRLIGLEVDGEVHLEPEQRAKDKKTRTAKPA